MRSKLVRLQLLGALLLTLIFLALSSTPGQTGPVLAQGSGGHRPTESRLTGAHPFRGDVRHLPPRRPVRKQPVEPGEPEPDPTFYGPGSTPPGGSDNGG